MIDTIINILRIIFGLIFLFFVPGYAFTLVLFPKKKDLSLTERLGFSGAFSIVIDVLLVLFIDVVLKIPTTPQNIFISLSLFTLTCLAIWGIETFVLSKRFLKKD